MRQKINKDIQDLNSDLEQVSSINIYRTLHFKYTKYTFFSAPHHTYSKIEQIIGSNTPQQMQKKRNHSKQSLRSQCNQIRTQEKETQSKVHNYMETKQPASE